jgi:aspartate/methionine/tyrosine aminotransferase
MYRTYSGTALPKAQIISPDGIEIPQMDLGHLFSWFNEVEKSAAADQSPVVIAAVGRPTAPIFPPLLEAVKEYWANQTGDSIGYGPLTGIEEHRVRMATALSKSYGVSVSADDVVFTVGGHHAIAASFAAFRSLHPGKKVVVSYPVYPAYSGWSSHENQLVKVDTMPAGGIFSAEALQAALQRESPAEIGMFVFCSPNNPCGYVIAREEWLKIAPILRQYEDSMIMLDEAYMEMSFDPYTSLLSVAPDLHSRIILVRSGTKGFSASGERMAIAGNVAPVVRRNVVRRNVCCAQARHGVQLLVPRPCERRCASTFTSRPSTRRAALSALECAPAAARTGTKSGHSCPWLGYPGGAPQRKTCRGFLVLALPGTPSRARWSNSTKRRSGSLRRTTRLSWCRCPSGDMRLCPARRPVTPRRVPCLRSRTSSSPSVGLGWISTRPQLTGSQ